MAAGDLAIHLLGGFSWELRGRPLAHPNYGKSRLLLCYLALECRMHPRDRLAGLFWPDLEPAAARANLRLVLSDIRGVLGAEADGRFRTNRETVGLAADRVEVDAQVLLARTPRLRADTALTQAELYRGPLLEGVNVPDDLTEFDQWLLLQREATLQAALACLRRAIGLAREQGEADLATRAARRYVAMAPWDEWGHRTLMQIFLDAGNRPAAASAFKSCREVLTSEFGITPSQATVDRLQAQPGEIDRDALNQTLNDLINTSMPQSGFENLAALMARRLERLGDLRVMAQWIAVAGMPLATAQLAALSGWEETRVGTAMEHLHTEGVAKKTAAGWQLISPLFARAAVHACNGERRRAMHRQLAEQVSSVSHDWYAQQWEAAGERAHALLAWQRAGDTAFDAGRFEQASHCYFRGLEFLGAPAGAGEHAFFRRLALGRAAALTAMHGENSPQAQQAFTLAFSAPAAVLETDVWKESVATWVAHYSRHLYEEAERAIEKLSTAAAALPRAVHHFPILLPFMRGVNAFWRGDLTASIRLLDQCLARHRRAAGGKEGAGLDGLFFGHDFQLILDCMLSTVCAWLPAPDRAASHAAAAMDYAVRTGRPSDLGFALLHQPLVHYRRRDLAATDNAARALAAHAVHHGQAVYLAVAVLYLNWGCAQRGEAWRPAEAEVACEFVAQVWPVSRPLHLAMIADCHLAGARRTEARTLLCEARNSAGRRHFCLEELSRLERAAEG